jgi:aldose 1-epimerase
MWVRMKLFLIGLILPIMLNGANYSAAHRVVDGVPVITLTDAERHAEVSIAPSIGNIAYEFKVNGKNALYFPYAKLSDFEEKPTLCAIPFLAPWANRLEKLGFSFEGKSYTVNPALGNLRLDGNQLPIHGLLSFSKLWKVTEYSADGMSAHVTSRLEFWRYPELMAQFPFAHTIEMTYRLSNAELQVETVIHNLGASAMPVSIGYHPYFNLHDAPRGQWSVHIGAKQHLILSDKLLATGEAKPMELPDSFTLEGRVIDDGFYGLTRGADGMASFSVQGKSEKIEVRFGPKYPVNVTYAPEGKDFICFEPMAAMTNALNSGHALQTLGAGENWRESFRVRVTGF